MPNGAAAIESFTELALTWMPMLLFGLLVYFVWRSTQLVPRVKTKAIQPTRTSVGWDQVAGLEEAKEELREVVDFLREPTRFRRLDARVPKGLLLYGRLARARRCSPRPWRTRRAPRSTPRAPRRSSRCSRDSAPRGSA